MDIKELRDEIARIDEEIAGLFVERMEAVRGIAEYKKERGLPVEDREHELHIIEKRSAEIQDEEMRKYYIQFIQDTMDISKRWQHRLMHGQQIAMKKTQDPRDVEALQKTFPDGNLVEFGTYREAYEAVVKGDCDAAVLPFERSYDGEVGPVLDLMFAGNLHMNGSCDISDGSDTIRYAIMSRTENSQQGDADGAFMIMFTVKDETGGLAKAINVISAFDFNMRILKSRPMKDLAWHYYFYAEAEGDDTSENGQRMLNALKVSCPMVKVVGRYGVQK